MISGQYIAGMFSLLSSIFFLPGIDVVLRVALIVVIVLIGLAFHFFLAWKRLQEIMAESIYEKLLVRMIRDKEMIEFLEFKQKKQNAEK